MDLPKRVGTSKIRRLFGIESVDRNLIDQAIHISKESPHSDHASLNFERAKPFFKRLRQSQSAQALHLRDLDSLKMMLCDQLEVTISYEGSKHTYQLRDWEWVIVDNTLYISSAIDNSEDMLADSVGAAVSSLFRKGDGGDAYAKIYRCSPKSRRQLLKKMCGDEFEIDLDSVERESTIIWEGQSQESSCNESEGNIEVEEPSVIDQPSAINSTEPKIDDTSFERDNSEAKDLEHNKVLAQEHQPRRPKERRSLVVRRQASTRTANYSGQRIVTDGELCEKKAEEFEKQDTPPRFPLRVGHITGYDAPGCDLFSFETDADRAAFIDPQTRNESLISRFIEVKGRSSRDAEIELKGNELTAARKYNDHYYIYRLHENGDGSFQVSVLQDPLAESSDVLVHSMWIDLSRAQGTMQYLLTYEHDPDADGIDLNNDK